MDMINIARERSYPTPYSTSPLLPMILMSLAVQKNSPTTKHEFQQEYDYIVVGAGSAGSVVASRLSEMSCVTVLLLEAGKPPPRLNDVPALARSYWNTDIDWQYTTVPQKYTGGDLIDRRVPWPSGKAIGGSSILNAMLYVRGNHRNYDEWAELGAEGWSYEDVLPYFLKLEDNTDPVLAKSKFHATGGPITVSRPSYNPQAKLAVEEAVSNLGYEFVDPNGARQNGFYDYQGSIRRGQRCSTAKAYLVPAENRTNLDILANARARKVLIEDKRAVGVEFDFNGRTCQVRARREVIMSAGTTNSAQLLMLSGIGPLSELQKFRIPLVADLPVGFNFQDHPATVLAYELDSSLPTFSQQLEKDEKVYEYIDNRTGPLTSCEGFELLSFLSNSGSPEDIPDQSVYIADFERKFITQVGLTPQAFAAFTLPLVNKTSLICASQLLHPYSRGTVGLNSANPYDPPKIDPNYLADFRDVLDMVEGMKKCQNIMKNKAMEKVGAKPANIVVPGCEEYVQDEDLYFRCIVRQVVATTSHQVGTAKMGDPNDPNTVVDPQLRVKGIKGLRVVDASIMPTIPWGNMNIPTIMVAEKGSDIIKSEIECSG